MAKFLSYWILVGSIFVMGCGDDEAPLPVSDFLNSQEDGTSGESGGESVEPVGDVSGGPGGGTKDTETSEEGGGVDAILTDDIQGGEGAGDGDTELELDSSPEVDVEVEGGGEGENIRM